MTTCYHPEKRLFFVHVPKCAGTSIAGHVHSSTQEWSGCWLNQQLPGWTRKGLPNGHQPVFAIERFTGHPVGWWKSIIVPIRNPFEQQLSQWLFWRLRGRTNAEKNRPWHEDDKFAVENTFEDFVEDPRSCGPMGYCGDRWLLTGGVYRWWTTIDNRMPENVRILRVEDFPAAIEEELGRHGGQKITQLPRYNAQSETDLREHYTPRAVEAVARKFSWSLAVYYPEALTELRNLVNSQAVAVG